MHSGGPAGSRRSRWAKRRCGSRNTAGSGKAGSAVSTTCSKRCSAAPNPSPRNKESHMIDAPEIVQTTAQQAAVIRLTIPRNEMGKAFGPAVQELMTTLADQGVKPVGAVFAHHLRLPPDMWDFELGVETASPVKSSGRVKPGQLPAAKVARTVYRGPYDGLPGAWGDFVAWMKDNGHEQ